MVAGTDMSAADPLSPVSCKVGPLWIELVPSAHPTDIQLDCNLKTVESTPGTLCHVSPTTPVHFFSVQQGTLSC